MKFDLDSTGVRSLESSNFTLLHLYGTPYEMGFAQAVLMKDELEQVLTGTWTYLEKMVEDELLSTKLLPEWLKKLIADVGLDAALDATYLMTRSYIDDTIFDEMRGMADGGGLDYWMIVKIHMLAGLTKGRCSMFGAWGSAVEEEGSLIQLKAFDWHMDGVFRDHSQVTVYHPSSATDGHAFANIGFSGFIGGLTGVSESRLGLSQIGVSYPDESFGKESRFGVPFIFLFRDILQFDYPLDSAVNRLANHKRTCDAIIGIGDGKSSEFRGFESSSSVLNMFDDLNLMPDAPWHPRIENVVYWGMDWVCPAYDEVMSEEILKYHGHITAEIGIQQISPVMESGDLHIAYYDLTKMQLYVSFAAPVGVAGPERAFDRQYVQFDLATLFAELPY